MTTLHFPKLSQYPRLLEPVSFSIPWAQGRLLDPSHLCIWDGETQLPIQVQSLGTWPDGSVRWSLVHFQPNLPGNTGKDFNIEVVPESAQPESEAQVSVSQTETEWEVDTGPLSFALRQGTAFALHAVSLQGSAFWSELTVGAFEMRLVEKS